jgi:hypothetical protein
MQNNFTVLVARVATNAATASRSLLNEHARQGMLLSPSPSPSLPSFPADANISFAIHNSTKASLCSLARLELLVIGSERVKEAERRSRRRIVVLFRET